MDSDSRLLESKIITKVRYYDKWCHSTAPKRTGASHFALCIGTPCILVCSTAILFSEITEKYIGQTARNGMERKWKPCKHQRLAVEKGLLFQVRYFYKWLCVKHAVYIWNIECSVPLTPQLCCLCLMAWGYLVLISLERGGNTFPVIQ